MFQDLLTSRRFVPVFICQFFSALSDNFIKNALVILILFKLGTVQGGALVTLAGAALIMPMFILSALGGELADKYDKARVARWLKVAEIPIAAIAGLGFMLDSIPLLFTSIVLFGCGAALFGPIKYGILPDHLERQELPAANALVEGATFLAILLGTILGGLAMVETATGPLIPSWMIALIVVAFAAIGWVSARAIQQTGPAAPDLTISKNPIRSTINRIGELRSGPPPVDRRLDYIVVLACRHRRAIAAANVDQGPSGRRQGADHTRSVRLYRRHRVRLLPRSTRQPTAAEPRTGAGRGAAHGSVLP